MKKTSNIVLIIIFLIGLSLLLYPTVSDYWNSFRQTRAIAGYVEAVAEINDIDYQAILEDARAYNQSLVGNKKRYIFSEQKHEKYESLLNISGNGIMGYIEIPSIGVSLPIYHGVEDTILQVAVGHIEGSSLPVGGLGTHCVVSGHRGLPSAKLFTDLDKLVEGDTFLLRVLDEALTYEVDQIHIVEPQEVDFLDIEKDKDLCTLITCTPYGVNSHRLLVRGHRIENQEIAAQVRVTADAVQIEPVLVAPAIGVPVLLLLLVGMLLKDCKRDKKTTKKQGRGDKR